MKPLQASILLAAGLALAGCTKAPPLDRTVSAETPSALSAWRDRMGDDLTPAQWQDFDEALQEIRFKIIIDPAAPAGDAVDAKVRAAIAGHSVRDVLRLGFESKLARLDAEGTLLESFLRMNSQIKPGGAQSAHDLSDSLYTQISLLRKVDEEMERTGQKLDLLLQRPHGVRKPREPLP